MMNRVVMAIIGAAMGLSICGSVACAGTLTNMGQTPDWQGTDLVSNTNAGTARTSTRISNSKQIRGQLFQARQDFVWSGLTLKMGNYKNMASADNLQIKLFDMVDDEAQDGLPDNNNLCIGTNTFDMSSLASGGAEALSDGDWIQFDFDVTPSVTMGTRCAFLIYWDDIGDNNGVKFYISENSDPLPNSIYRGDTTYADAKWDDTAVQNWGDVVSDSADDLVFAVTTDTTIQNGINIIWEPASNTTNETDILTEGTKHVAVNTGGATAKTVNGVLFDGAGNSGKDPLGSAGGGRVSGTVAGYTSADQIWQLLSTSSSRYGKNIWHSFDITGLTTGQKYKVQLFSANRAVSSYNVSYPDHENSAIALQLGTDAGDAMGQNIVGSFTATSTTQPIYLFGTTHDYVHINAYQVRNVTPPLLLNGGFEDPYHTGNDGTDPNSWTVSETTTGTNPDRQVRTKNEYKYSGYMGLEIGAGGSNHDGQLWQDLTTEVGQPYKFSIWSRVSGSVNGQLFKVEIRNGSGTGGTVLTTLNSGEMTTSWVQHMTMFTATSTTTTIHISDVSTAGAGDNADIVLDDASVVVFVPTGTVFSFK